MKTCFGTDEKDRFLSNLKLYRSYITIKVLTYVLNILRKRLYLNHFTQNVTQLLRASSAILAAPPRNGKCSSSEKFTFVLLNKLKYKVELTPF
jgi:hypothetical protein